MPSFTELAIALPCDSLDDFPIDHRGANAENLLACWTGMWHPALIKQTRKFPEIQSVSETSTYWQTDDDTKAASVPLIVVPNISAAALDSATIMDWTADCEALVIEEISDRRQIIDQAVTISDELLGWQKSLSEKTVDDFYALGYAFLQTMIMSLKLRFSSNLDLAEFETKVVEAADAAIKGDAEQTTDKLFACFDALLEEKNCYYPVQPQLCELLLTHPNTLGKSLTKQFESCDSPISILITGQDARKLPDKNPSTLATLKQLIESDQLSIVGGLDLELDENLVCGETIANQIQIGRDSLQEIFGRPPNVYARRNYGLNPTTPSILNSFGYDGAIHANFSGNAIPSMGSGVMRWTGDDDEHVLAISENPMDAADSGAFLELGMVLGDMIDSAHSATALLTHWPNKTCQSLADLKRISSFVPLFGEFVTLDQVFDEAYDPGYGQTFTADDYESPHLQDAIRNRQLNPISRYTDYWRRMQQVEAVRRVTLLATIDHDLPQSTVAPMLQQVEQLQAEIENATLLKEPPLSPAPLDEKIQTLLADATLLMQSPQGETKSAADHGSSTVYQIANGQATKQRIEVRPPAELALATGSLKLQPPVHLAVNRSSEQSSSWILDLPGFSNTAIDFAKVQKQDLFQKDPPLTSDLLLQNEFFKVHLDEKSGGIRSIQQHAGKTNLTGQQLSIRLPKEHPAKQQYADMIADSIETIENETLSAAIKSTGRLVAGDQELARFDQTVRVVRGLSRIEIEIKLQPLESLTPSTNHYICSRLAWKSEGARLLANVLDSQEQVASPWFHATKFFTVQEPRSPSVSLLTGGLPFHRRANRRMVDSLLMVHNESQTSFSFAIDVDQPYPSTAAATRLTPVLLYPALSNQSAASNPTKAIESGQTQTKWLFHFNRKNILATSAKPIFNDDGKCNGVSLRLKETESRAAQLIISSFKFLRAAEIVTFNGEVFETLPLDDTDKRKVSLVINPMSFLQVNLYFQA